jgi:hypothetical protein
MLSLRRLLKNDRPFWSCKCSRLRPSDCLQRILVHFGNNEYQADSKNYIFALKLNYMFENVVYLINGSCKVLKSALNK